MATLVVTIVTPDSVNFLKDQLQVNGSSPYTVTNDSAQIDRISRYVDGVANAAFNQTSVTIAVS